MQKRTVITTSIVGLALFIVMVAAVSYAYFTSGVNMTGSPSTEAVAAKISANFGDTTENNASIDLTNLIPGDSFTKTFTLENTGNVTLKYRIAIKDLSNGFERTQDITYVLKEEKQDAEPVEITGTIESTYDSATDTVGQKTTIVPLTEELAITPSDGVKNYTLTITYVDDPEYPQYNDMGKSITGKIFIQELGFEQ